MDTVYYSPGSTTTTPTQTFYGPFSGLSGWAGARTELLDFMVPGKINRGDIPTIRLGATPSGLSSAHLHHPPIFLLAGCLPAAQPTESKHWQQCNETEEMHVIVCRTYINFSIILSKILVDKVVLSLLSSVSYEKEVVKRMSVCSVISTSLDWDVIRVCH